MRTVLVTGATGAIGSVVTKYLLEEEGTRVRLLLRAESPAHLDERLGTLFRFWGLDPFDARWSTRFDAVCGDVTLPLLGLDRPTYERLSAEVTHVVHAAGNVKLNRPFDEARRSAVDSASHVVSFVESCRVHGAFQKLEYLSTVGVAGKLPGTVPERAFPEARSFRNSYEAAKAEAETFLLQKIHEGLPATVHRPSMVVGDSHDGRIIQFQVFYHLCEFLSGRRTGGVIPEAHEIRLDIIPVDYVARAIQLSSQSSAATGRIFHLCAGPSQAPRIDNLARRVRAFFVARGRSAPPLRPISPALMRTAVSVAGWFTSGKTRRALRTVPYFLDYLDAPQTFANVRSTEFFSAARLEAPAVDSYLDAVLSYYLSHQAGATVSGQSSRAVA